MQFPYRHNYICIRQDKQGHTANICMMKSSNGNIFRVTGPLCRKFIGPGDLLTQRPVTRSFDVFFDPSLNKWLSKQLWGWLFETPSRSLWRHCNGNYYSYNQSECGHLYWAEIRTVEAYDTDINAIILVSYNRICIHCRTGHLHVCGESWKVKANVMGMVIGQGHIIGPLSNWLFFLFQIKSTTNS